VVDTPDPIVIGRAPGAPDGYIVRFTVPSLLSGAVADRAGELLGGLTHALPDGAWVVLDFTGVQVVNSAFMARMVMLYKRVTPKGEESRLVACNVPPLLVQTLTIAMLNKLIPIAADLDAAIAMASA
jgi:anti-anti-sigma regulatory factor